MFKFAAKLQKKHGLPVACFGHAGDGNIHTNVMVDYNQPGAKQRAEKCLDELFRWVIASGGAISGEHGIGLAKKRWWPQAVSPEARELHRTVKRALDPQGHFESRANLFEAGRGRRARGFPALQLAGEPLALPHLPSSNSTGSPEAESWAIQSWYFPGSTSQLPFVS